MPALAGSRSPLGGGSHDRSDDASGAALQAGLVALQRAVATRRTLARDQDPGPPQLPDMMGLSCGFKGGKPTCSVDLGKGDTLDVDPSSFSPEERHAAFDAKRPKSCPPARWNWIWESCCAPGKRFDFGRKGCVAEPPKQEQPPAPPQPPLLPLELPPAPPEEKGDFPLPAPDPAYA